LSPESAAVSVLEVEAARVEVRYDYAGSKQLVKKRGSLLGSTIQFDYKQTIASFLNSNVRCILQNLINCAGGAVKFQLAPDTCRG